MKELKRVLAAGLSAGLLIASLAGCGSSSSSSGEAGVTAYSGDVCEDIMGLSADTVIATVNGEDLTALDLSYWLTYDANILAYYYYGSLEDIDWEEEYSDDLTVAEYILEDALSVAVNYKLISIMSESLGIELTDEQIEEVDEIMQEYIDSFGETLWDEAVEDGTIDEDDYDDEAKAAWIQAAGEADLVNEAAVYVTTPDYLRSLNELYELYSSLQDFYFGEGGEYEPTDEDIAQYIEDEGYVCSQSILFMYIEDDDGNTIEYADMDDDQKEQLREEAQAALDAILASDDPDTTFNEYQEESDDSGSNTAGATYIFQDGDMVDEYYEAVVALEVDEMCVELVESEDYGYFIIKRCAVEADSVPLYYYTYGYTDYTIEYLYISDAFSNMLSNWNSEAEVETNEAFDEIDMESFTENLIALQEELYPSDTDDDSDE